MNLADSNSERDFIDSNANGHLRLAGFRSQGRVGWRDSFLNLKQRKITTTKPSAKIMDGIGEVL